MRGRRLKHSLREKPNLFLTLIVILIRSKEKESRINQGSIKHLVQFNMSTL